MSNTISFEALAKNTINTTMNGSHSPFRDALKQGFNLIGNTIATADAVVTVARYNAELFKLESAQEFLVGAQELDQRTTRSAMMRQLENLEYAKAMQAQRPVEPIE